MPAFVRSPRDERIWSEARTRAKAAGFAVGSDKYVAYANAVFHRAKGMRKSRERSGILETLRHGSAIFMKAGPKDILEMLAALEHEQWMHWSKAIAARGVVDKAQVAKWRADWVPYAELDDATKEFDRQWARKALARVREVGLAKSRNKPMRPDRAGKMSEPELHEPKGSLTDVARPRAVLDGHALVQRPDHGQPVAGRVVAVGRDGIHLRDDSGKHHRVRHEHVLDHQPPIGEEEWLDAADALHRQGVPIDAEQRFASKTNGDDEAMLEGIKESGLPIDTERLKKEGTSGDIKEVLDRHVNKEPRPSEMPTVVSADRQRQAPGWEQVFPDGKGRVSRQKRPPKRLYADDNDRERDTLFEGAKETGMVSKVRLSPESEPVEQEHLLRYATNVLQSLAEVVGPPNNPPTLVIAPQGVEAESEDPGAHYNARANTLELGMGEPESLAHAYGHVFDAAFGNGKYASTEQGSPLAELVASLREAKGTADLDVQLATAERREEEPPDSPRRFWTSPPEVFARFFEQFVDEALGEGKAQPQHEYVRGVDQPGAFDPDEMARAGQQFRRLLGGRDKRQSGVRKITAAMPRDRSVKRDELASHLMEEAKGDTSEAGQRVVSALTHGVHSRHLTTPPAHYDDERAAEHRALVRRARKRQGDDGDQRMQPHPLDGDSGRSDEESPLY
jgi:hypothetical protein